MTTACSRVRAKAEETTAADAAADGEKKEIYLLTGQEAIYLTGTAWQTAQIEQLLILQIRQMYM